MSVRRALTRWLVVLGLLHGIVICAVSCSVEIQRARSQSPTYRSHALHLLVHPRPSPRASFCLSLTLHKGSFGPVIGNTTEAIR